ncbi:unnamed protein product [Adineta steineri]|uniref:Uncharacterized protein n=1 Tax=Adineta steineri TaxID=433720 RepID=A0A815TJZ7_9BILA|nr:unnamed protein product [Adineta steineri]CAF1506535.1 unnamed protein product [Adineta steineri]CAF4007278.1 unnamed protein product [Adineta steineri]CAF4114282.1 unnamed protein product [Adineta steineri]
MPAISIYQYRQQSSSSSSVDLADEKSSKSKGAYGCGACEIKGITVTINSRSRKKLRVFPLVSRDQQQPHLRTNKTELRDRCRGHISPCLLRELAHFGIGTNFASDSLQNIL